jgi:hypothetical protein
MSDVSIQVTTSLGSGLLDILMCDELQPGDAPSYQLCKSIYLYHPLGQKMTESPVKKAQSQARELTVQGAPDRIVEEFARQWAADHCDENILQLATTARVYGVGSLALVEEKVDPGKPVDLDSLWDKKIVFNCLDPLNTGGTIVLDQDPNSPLFQKHTTIGVSGTPYHRSRTVVLMNERPVYIAYTSSAFGFVGRSVYQRPLFPMKTFIQTMITDQAVTEKAALLVAKVHQPGSIADRAMAGFTALKRAMLKGAKTGNVLSISAGSHNGQMPEEIETLNMQNVDTAATMARTNAIKNIATAADMPAIFLENETLTEGFGEGKEDSKQISDYIDGLRAWLAPAYEFLDVITMRRAWNPEFYKIIQEEYPEYADVPYERAFYRWKNDFTAVWPNFLKEPDSEAVETEKVKLEGIANVVEVFLPRCDPDNAALLLRWAAENLNANKVMFPTSLVLDWEALANYEPPTPAVEPKPELRNDSFERGADPVVRLLGKTTRPREHG